MLVCLAFIFYHLLTFIRYTEENVSFALWIVFVTLLNLGSALYNPYPVPTEIYQIRIINYTSI